MKHRNASITHRIAHLLRLHHEFQKRQADGLVFPIVPARRLWASTRLLLQMLDIEATEHWLLRATRLQVNPERISREAPEALQRCADCEEQYCEVFIDDTPFHFMCFSEPRLRRAIEQKT